MLHTLIRCIIFLKATKNAFGCMGVILLNSNNHMFRPLVRPFYGWWKFASCHSLRGTIPNTYIYILCQLRSGHSLFQSHLKIREFQMLITCKPQRTYLAILLTRCFSLTETSVRLVSTSAYCSIGPVFRSQPEYRLFIRGFSWLFSVLPRTQCRVHLTVSNIREFVSRTFVPFCISESTSC
jgi:hypothetical protein